MVAHENGALADVSRHQLRLPPRPSSADSSKRKSAGVQRFSDDADEDSDTEDDAPIAVHFLKMRKMDKPRPSSSNSSQSSSTNSGGALPVSRIGHSKVYHKSSETAAPTTSHSQHQAPQAAAKERDAGAKRAKPEAPKFLLLLYEILQSENPKVIRWSEDGLSLQILDPALVTDKILPKYFNHTNFHSFQRQLNYFGFRKWTKSKTDICTFSHPYFRQNQPEMLQLIKRKKAPRRTPVVDKVDGYCHQLDDKKLVHQQQQQPPSPTTGKRKLATADEDHIQQQQQQQQQQHGSHHSALQSHNYHNHYQQQQQQQQQQQRQQHDMNASNVPSQQSLHGVAVAPLSQHHREQGGMQQLPASALLNNVISPLAASECHKKAKKIDKKAYLPATSAEFLHRASSSSSDPIATSMCEMSTMQNVYSSQNNSSHSLPTLDIVRSRIIRRQNVSNQAHASANGGTGGGEHYAYHHGYASPLAGIGAQMMELNRTELMNPMTPIGGGGDTKNNFTTTTTSSPAAFTNSFSDPVDILLRIKQSASSSDGQKQSQSQKPAAQMMMSSSDLKQEDNLTSLQNFLVSHTLYTNRLESQLKMAVEENEALRQLADAKHREVEALQSERKRLQHENAVLVDDKNKLFEINRELLSKLFPQ